MSTSAIAAACPLLLGALAGSVLCLVRAALNVTGEPPVILARLSALDACLVSLTWSLS